MGGVLGAVPAGAGARRTAVVPGVLVAAAFRLVDGGLPARVAAAVPRAVAFGRGDGVATSRPRPVASVLRHEPRGGGPRGAPFDRPSGPRDTYARLKVETRARALSPPGPFGQLPAGRSVRRVAVPGDGPTVDAVGEASALNVIPNAPAAAPVARRRRKGRIGDLTRHR